MKSLWPPRWCSKNLNTQQSLEDRSKQIYRPACIHEPHGPIDLRTLDYYANYGVCKLQHETQDVLWITDFYLKFPSLKIAAEIHQFSLKENPKQPEFWKLSLKHVRKYSCAWPPLDMSTLGDRNPETSDKSTEWKTTANFLEYHSTCGFLSVFFETFITCSDATGVCFNFRLYIWLSG